MKTTIDIVTSQDQFIKTYIYKPDDIHGKTPLLIFCHGFFVTHKYFEYYANKLVNYNFTCILFDFRGGDDYNQSSGNLFDTSILTEAKDLEDIIDFVSKLDYIDKENIYLIGHSQGALVASLVASRYPEKFKSIYLLSPAFFIPHLMKEKTLPQKGELQDNIVGYISRKYILDARKINIFDDVTNFRKEVYIFYGSDEYKILKEYSQKAFNEYENINLTIIDNQKHNFTKDARDLVIEKILKTTGVMK